MNIQTVGKPMLLACQPFFVAFGHIFTYRLWRISSTSLKIGELDEDSVVRNFRTTAADGKSYNVTFYNLDKIISLGRLSEKREIGKK